MFENKVINGYIYATRFIISWVKSGGKFDKHGKGYDDFRKGNHPLESRGKHFKNIRESYKSYYEKNTGERSEYNT